MDHDARIEAAIADLESQDRRNIAATLDDGKSPAKRYLSETLLRTHGDNSDIQEQALIKHINYADRNRIVLAVLPPHFIHQLQPL